MNGPFLHQLFFLLLSVVIIVLLTSKLKIHPFFSLAIACFVVGLSSGISFSEVLGAMKTGFGHIMSSLGFLIVLGTTLGVLLERTGRTVVLASYILRKLGSPNAPAAMSMTGFIVGMPIFCDSGFIVLSGLNMSVARKAGVKIITLAICLATGLYSVHCLIPPHPGATAAAGLIGVDPGKLILFGIIAAIPASFVGFLWARFAGERTKSGMVETREDELTENRPSVIQSFLPVLLPILLIAVKSILTIESQGLNGLWGFVNITGDPVIALAIGVVLCLLDRRSLKKVKLNQAFGEAIEKSGGILVIIGAGGAFGAVLSATNIGENFSNALPLASMGILFPFLLTSLLKTAQGSSTVAIITSASIVLPLLPSSGLASETGKLLAVLSMGAGSMMISHANDAYFWVISKFERIEMENMLKVYSVATVLMGVTSLLVVYLFSFIL